MGSLGIPGSVRRRVCESPVRGMRRPARRVDAQTMPNDCPLLTELDTWFSLATDLLAPRPGVLRDVLVVVGAAGRVSDVASVTAADCQESGGYVFVYPPTAPHLSLPLTPAFVAATGLLPAAWPAFRANPAADAIEVERAIAAVDAVYARRVGRVRPAGPDRLVELRMHAWRHELGSSFGVLARFYGDLVTAA